MYLRPDDGDAFRQAVRVVRQRADVPVAFGGQVSEGSLHLSELVGVRTAALKNLQVRAEAGLGGQVMTSRRPGKVSDYRSALTISHDYDVPVLAEGICSVAAAPVTVRGCVRGVIYGAARGVVPLGDRMIDTMVDATRRLAGELAVRDEVDRRLQLLDAVDADRTALRDSVAIEEVRELHAEFRAIAQGLDDTALRDRLHRACERLAHLSDSKDVGDPPALSPRELDVLSQIALGCSNAETARRLSLQPETVKAYLRSAMRKLDVHTRHEAVVAARRRGALP
ncbi:LuxR C-terminal-related transcriptional regulator [Saccharopolyspora sp. NPDC050389]|uniref:helix-turn-helix transcriptional regulator n=1 Tax=Saccharopolyspora sp. NPDC050389 TaxID=3155516 RepID=UPI0034094A80